jgi:hypothetical protein
MTPFWTNEPTILMRRDQLQIWPTNDMDANAKLNAITRLVVALTIAAFAVTFAFKFLAVGALTIVALAIYQSATKLPPHREAFTPQELKDHTAPTEKNPLMNVLLPEINGNPNRKPALKAYLPETNDLIKAKLKTSSKLDPRIFRGTNDELDLEHSMRNFYTMPSTTVPNKQDEFAEFCYSGMISAKEGTGQALHRNNPSTDSAPLLT